MRKLVTLTKFVSVVEDATRGQQEHLTLCRYSEHSHTIHSMSKLGRCSQIVPSLIPSLHFNLGSITLLSSRDVTVLIGPQCCPTRNSISPCHVSARNVAVPLLCAGIVWPFFPQLDTLQAHDFLLRSYELKWKPERRLPFLLLTCCYVILRNDWRHCGTRHMHIHSNHALYYSMKRTYCLLGSDM
jgi:hypothetical protein